MVNNQYEIICYWLLNMNKTKDIYMLSDYK